MSPQADALSTRIMRFLLPQMLNTDFIAFIAEFIFRGSQIILLLPSKQTTYHAYNILIPMLYSDYRREDLEGQFHKLQVSKHTVKTAPEMKGCARGRQSLGRSQLLALPSPLGSAVLRDPKEAHLPSKTCVQSLDMAVLVT